MNIEDSELLAYLKSIDLRTFLYVPIIKRLKEILLRGGCSVEDLEECKDYLELNAQVLRANGILGYHNISIEEYSLSVKMIVEWIDIEIELLTQNQLTDIKQLLPKSEKLKESLIGYGFFELPLVVKLNPENQAKLVELLVSEKLPYRVAMFEFLGFISYLNKEHFDSNYKRDIIISKWFSSDKDGRAVRGYINSLTTHPNGGRYKAHLHKEKVEKDYRKLK